MVGVDVYHTEEVYRRVAGVVGQGGHAIASGTVGETPAADPVFSPFEVACLDIQGKAAGRPVSDLLGGAVRDAVPFSAYLFYKWAAHPGQEPDGWGEALDPDGIVRQARRLVDSYGFTALKLKGGVFPPEQEVEAIRALRAAFPDHPLRLDPNAAWTPADLDSGWPRSWTACSSTWRTRPRASAGMAEVAAQAPMPLATNMCVVAFAHLPPAIAAGAVQVVLADHHYWGGLRRSRLLAGICETFGLGRVDALQPAPGHQPGRDDPPGGRHPQPRATPATPTSRGGTEDVIAGSALPFSRRRDPVPDGPGLGVELDRDALAALHEQYLRCGVRERDDTGYMRTVDPSYQHIRPRW